jgi:predicted ATP-grasp superfamily ATP-dependent carboligase
MIARSKSKIVIYEFVTGGGLYGAGGDQVSDSIRREGLTMMMALKADFADLPTTEIHVLDDQRSPVQVSRCQIHPVGSRQGELELLLKLCQEVDWTILIAPDFELHRTRLVELAGGRLLGPSSAVVRVAADKQRTAEHLTANGVKVPTGRSFGTVMDFASEWRTFPAVVKPKFGAGSQAVRLVHNLDEVDQWKIDYKPIGSRIEEFCPGMAASVAFLCGPHGRFALPPSRQRLSDDGEFRYLGGSLPLPPEFAARATTLASRAVATLPDPLGYLGVDLVLGKSADGSEDVVIEINPRLTTSYVGLRALARENLAAAMLDVAGGRTPRLSFADRQLEFDSDGTIRWG